MQEHTCCFTYDRHPLPGPIACTQHIAADKVPLQEGFSLAGEAGLSDAASAPWSSTMPPNTHTLLPVSWAPAAAGAVSKPLLFKLDGKHRLQVKLLGRAAVVAAPKRRAGAPAAAGVGRAAGSDQALRVAAARSVPSAGTGTGSGAGSDAPPGAAALAAAACGSSAADRARFKAPPPRRSGVPLGQLRLKAPAATAAAQQQQQQQRPAADEPSTPLPAWAKQATVPSTGAAAAPAPVSRVMAPPLGAASSARSARPGSAAGGGTSSMAETSARVPSSVRKTFRYHTE
jgi:hypothetical protein